MGQQGGTIKGAVKENLQVQSVIMCGPGTRNNGPGILATPVQFRKIEQNYGAYKVVRGPQQFLYPGYTPQGNQNQGGPPAGLQLGNQSQEQGPPKGAPIPIVQIGLMEHRRGPNTVVRNLDHTSFSVPPPSRDGNQKGGQTNSMNTLGPSAKRARSRWNC